VIEGAPVCFSPEASFTVGGALVPAGVYCLRAALGKNPRLVPVAVMPFAFTVQQIAEGFVWLGLASGDAARTRTAALVFLFFSLAFWPWWMSVVNAVLESRPVRKWACIGLGVLTTAWFWVLYFPLVVGPESLLSVSVVQHSIFYSYFDTPAFEYTSRTLLRVLYFLSVAVPIALGSKVFGWVPGVMVISSVVVAATVYSYAFISVWCFFAAVLTGSLCLMFHRLPTNSPGPT
jgi:hypothetical protein